MSRVWSAESSAEALGPLTEILKVVRLGDLRHLPNLLGFVDLDAELLHLESQALLSGVDLLSHVLKDPGQVPELVGPPRDLRQTLRLEALALQRRGRGREMADRTRHPAGQDHRGQQTHGEHAGGHHARQLQVPSNSLLDAVRGQMHDGCSERPIPSLACDRGHDLEHGPIQIASSLSFADHFPELSLVVLGQLERYVLAGHRAVDERHDRLVHDAHRDDVPPGHQLLDQTGQPDLVLQLLQELGAITDLHDPGLVDPGDARVLVDLGIHLALASLLHHRAALARQQRPEDVRLRLLLRVGAEREVHVGPVAEVGVPLLVADPQLVQDGVAGNGAQVGVDAFGRDSRGLGQRHQMGRDGRLHDHLLADGAFDFGRHLAGESGAERQEPGQKPALDLGFRQQRLAIRPRQHRRRGEHRNHQQARHHEQRSRSQCHRRISLMSGPVREMRSRPRRLSR